jgi:hypothetical protein
MDESSYRGLVIACILLVVFPTSAMVCYTLFAFPCGLLLSLVLGASPTVSLVSILAGLVAGVAGGVWVSRLAWPRQR